MRLLADWPIPHGNLTRHIQLFHGDLAQLPTQHAVDLLVVSAFPNDYTPTPTSLIGALHRAGVSVEHLARSKMLDMREEFACWLSRPIAGNHSFRHVLCVESGWRGTPPELTDDLFRALVPLFVTTFPDGSVAMPIIAAGDQDWPPDRMLESILNAAHSWLRRGLSVSVIKIVVFSEQIAESAVRTFLRVQRVRAGEPAGGSGARPVEQNVQETAPAYDVFVSYCQKDSVPARLLMRTILELHPAARIFYDQKTIRPGHSWLMDLAESLDGARQVAALLTPDYWSSGFCKDEFSAALTRQRDLKQPVLFPIYFRTAQIPYLFRTLQYVDCREADSAKLRIACAELCAAFTGSPLNSSG